MTMERGHLVWVLLLRAQVREQPPQVFLEALGVVTQHVSAPSPEPGSLLPSEP